MTANPMRKVLEILSDTALLQEGYEQRDGQLLKRFVEHRDALALETLVRRHAPMIWSVCRRNLTRLADVEDAFQATFLVFLRKAASIRSRDLLANWLYGVAYQTCRKLRQTAAKLPGPLPMPEPTTAAPDNAFGPELLTQLDRELSRLPEKYRSAIVLCHFQGKSLREAAEQMQVAEGTVGSRLTRGREMLARRLTRSGLTVSATSVAAVLTIQAASAGVPEALLTNTIKAVGQLAAGQVAVDALLSSGARTLADGVLHSLTLAKKKTAVVWLLLAAVVLGSGATAYYAWAEQETKPVQLAERASQLAKEPEVLKSEQAPKKDSDHPDPNKDGTAAEARDAARNAIRDYLASVEVPVWRGVSTIQVSGVSLFAHWPSRDIDATFDPATHEWTLTGSCRFDVPEGVVYQDGNGVLQSTEKWDCREREWKLVLAFNPSARAYEKKGLFFDTNWLGGHPTNKDDFARWLQGEFPVPKPSSDPITALHLVVEAPEATKLGLKPNLTYGKKDLVVEATSRGVRVRIDQAVERWTLEFGAPKEQFVKVGKYGGAYNPERALSDGLRIDRYAGPLIAVKHWVLDGGKQGSEWSCDPGEFVVREIEVEEKKVVRLAIDFIADNEYSRPATAKRDARCIVRGSLRVNSLLQPSDPKLGSDAADYKLSNPAPAGLRGMKFVPLPKGTFYRGWNGTKGSAKKTEITEDFEIAVYTVTQGQWQELMWNNPSWFSRRGGGKEAVKDITDEDLKQFPVESVQWKDVKVFIKRLNEREKGKGYVYRLPTHAEWEYACRCGATTEEECSYHFYLAKPTNDLSSKQANFNGNQPFGTGEKGPYLGRTTKVGSYAPNKLGLYDMHGNVWQGTDHSDDGGSDWRVRGGAWNNVAESCRAVCRSVYPFPGGQPNYSRPETIGFRLVRVPVR
jgi:RNA polymerase sigma factor (sigma-70 family)